MQILQFSLSLSFYYFLDVSPSLHTLFHCPCSDQNHHSLGLLQHFPTLALCFMPCHPQPYPNTFSTLLSMIFLKYSSIHSTNICEIPTMCEVLYWVLVRQWSTKHTWPLSSASLESLIDSGKQWLEFWRPSIFHSHPLWWELLPWMDVEFYQMLFLQLLRWSRGFCLFFCWCGVSH